MHQESTQPAPSAAKPQRLPPGAEHPSLLAAMFRPGTPMLWVPSSYFAASLTQLRLDTHADQRDQAHANHRQAGDQCQAMLGGQLPMGRQARAGRHVAVACGPS